MSGPLCTRLAEVCDRTVGLLPDGPARHLVERVRDGLDEPLRIAVAGRVSSGKSTLVNALLRQRIAPTDVGECTRYVTWYRHGLPERLEVVRTDGSRRSLALRADGTLPPDPIESGEAVSHLEVHLTHDSLRDLVIVDTPGLGSVSDGRSAATIEVLGLDRDSQQAVSRADALVFVLTAALRADEALVVRGFRDALEGTSASALSSLCVINKADLIGDGDEDPLDAAAALADDFTHALRGIVAGVRPLVSLLAETVESGRFTEGHAVALRALAAVPEPSRRAMLLSADRFVSSDVPIDPGDRAELVATLGLYGIEVALEEIAAGRRSATELVARFRELSGVDGLRSHLLGTFAANADALKANGALAALERLTYALTSPGLESARAELHDEIDALRIDPRMHRIQELNALQASLDGASLPPELEGDLQRLATEVDAARRLGLPAGAPPQEIRRAAATAAGAWKRFRNDGRAGTRQQWIADVMVRSCEQIWVDAGAEPT